MNTKAKSKKKRQSIAFNIVGIFFLIYAVSLLIPLFWGIWNSFLTRAEYNMVSAVIKVPSAIRFDNYINAWAELSANGVSMVSMTLNSLWYAAGSTALVLFANTMTAYVCEKYEFVGAGFIKKFQWITMSIPIMGNMAATLRWLRNIHVYDSYLYIVGTVGGLGFMFIFMSSTFRGLSWEYAEAAFMDGAGHFRVFFQVMLPQVLPTVTALFVSEFITRWNDSMTPLVYFPNLPTLASGLYVYQTIASRAINYPMLFAALVMCMIPVLVLFIFFQDTLMDLQLGGGVKG